MQYNWEELKTNEMQLERKTDSIYTKINSVKSFH